MTTVRGPDPDLSARQALRATGLLAEFNRSGVLDSADVHVARRLGALGGEAAPEVLLAVALAVRAARLGSVCVDLAAVASQPIELADGAAEPGWPEPTTWVEAARSSGLTDAGVLRLEGTLLYLDRYWREECDVCADLLARVGRRPPDVDEAVLGTALDRLFAEGWEEQRSAARQAAGQWLTVLTGGPGTGKTASVARMLAVVAEQHRLATGQAPRIALAAPTGKAAARLQESVAREAATMPGADRNAVTGLEASTLHRLLGWRPDNTTRFRHHRENHLPHDLVVVDEVSMVPLSLMARLLEALRPQARLVLVGDPDQLASVEAGAVLADVVAGFAGRADSPVVRLTEVHRTRDAPTSVLADLAQALRDGDAEAALHLLASDAGSARMVDPEDATAMAVVQEQVARAAYDVTVAAEHDDRAAALAGLDDHRLLCAHREGPYGVGGWNRLVERLVSERTGLTRYAEWYAGRPVLVTANDSVLGLSNGDLGVTTRLPDGRLRVVFRVDGAIVPYATTRLSAVETVYAMTVHKSQGSEARAVTVVLPPEDSPLLTRELLYTAVTRAREQVTVVGSAAAFRAAVERPVQRASGLAARLRQAPDARG
ncbi:exodeoxyribonuclease V subunit alpha [Nocardioides terrisoli]|uniref:exodeoxyribonuclease V subunit alpha n=1 Tax=Nocardioides terrisoli TaxID=3388267 RepID=UPI00287BA7D2|nr:exodeoxyribonuclease V subunit alpha [Nocardioides marmorisolisilvae]